MDIVVQYGRVWTWYLGYLGFWCCVKQKASNRLGKRHSAGQHYERPFQVVIWALIRHVSFKVPTAQVGVRGGRMVPQSRPKMWDGLRCHRHQCHQKGIKSDQVTWEFDLQHLATQKGPQADDESDGEVGCESVKGLFTCVLKCHVSLQRVSITQVFRSLTYRYHHPVHDRPQHECSRRSIFAAGQRD